MTGKLKYIFVLLISFYFINSSVYSAAEAGSDSIISNDNSDPGLWIFLPAARLSMDPMYIYNNDSDFSGTFTSIADFDFLQYKSYIFSFSMTQILEYSKKKP